MRRFLFIIVAISLFASCSGKRAISTGANPDDNGTLTAQEKVRTQDRVNEIERSIAQTRTKKKIHDNEVSIENYGEKRFLNAGRFTPVQPDDFVVGHMVDVKKYPDSAEAAVVNFFDDFRKNKITKNPAKYFTEENRTLLSMLFDEWYDSQLFPTSIRIGNGVVVGGESRFSARCFMGDGACLCDFVMVKEDDRWKMANFSGNLEEMKIPLEKGEEFEPEVYYFF